MIFLANPNHDIMMALICGWCIGTPFGAIMILWSVWRDRRAAREREKRRIQNDLRGDLKDLFWENMEIVWKE